MAETEVVNTRSTPANALPITGKALPEVDIDAPIAAAKARDFASISSAYDAAAAASPEAADIYRSLSILCYFWPNYDDRLEPYGPAIQMDGRRSAVPGDLTAADLAVVRDLLARARHPALRARLADILWIRTKDHRAARTAVVDLIAAAKTMETDDDWTDVPDLLRRALQIGGALGKKNDPWKTAVLAVEEALRAPIAGTAQFYVAQLLEVALIERMGGSGSLADLALAGAERAAAEKAWRAEAEYRRIEARLRVRAEQPEVGRAARIAAAEASVREAEDGHSRGALVTATILAPAIEELRQAGGDPARIQELRERLRVVQAESVSEMKVVSHEFDLTAGANAARAHVAGHDLHKAITRLAMGHPLTNCDAHRARVLKNAQDFPLQHLFGGALVSGDGRVIAQRGGLDSPDAEQAEAALVAEMFRQAAQVDWPVRAVGYIEPAREVIYNEHHPGPADLLPLVLGSPFIPPGHEEIFVRGLAYGFAGDFLVASHLLTPQIENCMRHVLQSRGVDVSNLESDLTQPVKLLGALFGIPETTEIFGKSLCFELRGHLIEKTGFSFRNSLSHGMLTDEEASGAAAASVWWLALRLCVVFRLNLKIAD